MNPFIRRIRNSEIGLLKNFLFSKNAEKIPFEHHDTWLKRVLNDFEQGETRVVFGAFLPNVRRIARYELAGCLFLKRSIFDDAIELKSLITANGDYLKSDNFKIENSDEAKQLIRRFLIEKAVLFCEMREFPKIEMELLQNEMKSEIRLLHDLGFKISYLREKYRRGKLVYVFEKKIGEIYQADPFNEIKIARWFIQRIFPSKILKDKTFDFDDFIVKIIPFERDKVAQNYRETKNYIEYQIKGEVAIAEFADVKNVDTEKLSTVFSKETHLRYILTNYKKLKPEIIEKFQDLNIHFITQDFLKKFAGYSKSSLSIPYSIKEIGGALTVLEKDKIELYSTYNEFAYFLISGIGSALHLSSEHGLILAIYCPYWINEGDGKIIGYCEVIAKSMTTFENAFKVFPDVPQALTEKEINFYKKLSNKNEEIPVLKCSKLRIFENPLTLSAFEERFNTDYLEKQLDINLSSSAYLSIQTCQQFRNIKISTRFMTKPADNLKSNSVFIMYARYDQNLKFVSALAKNLKKLGLIVNNWLFRFDLCQ